MKTLTYRTITAKEDNINKEWLLVDAEKEVLGRMCTGIAYLLRGKNKTNFSPHVDCGDNVIVINADKVRLTGNKLEDKVYLRHTGHPGGQRETTAKELLATKPTAMVEKAVKGMLPKNTLGRALYRNLYVYAGSQHPHEAQQPKLIKVSSIK